MATTLRGLRAQSIGTTPIVVGSYTAPSKTTGVMLVDLTISNTLNGPTIVVTAAIKNGSTVTNLCVNAVVMQGGAIEVCDGKPKVLNSGDQIIVNSNQLTSCDVVASVSEVD